MKSKTADKDTVSATVRLVNMRGLHARASAKFIKCVERFDDVEVEVTSHNDIASETIIADSIMELLMLGSACGEEITIKTWGKDAKATSQALVKLIEGSFGEKE